MSSLLSFLIISSSDSFIISSSSHSGPKLSSSSSKSLRGPSPEYSPSSSKSLKTNELFHKELFDEDINALSEDGKFEGIFAKEYEVFEITF